MEVGVPADLATALRDRDNARNAFDGLPASHREAIIDWLDGADDPRHRAERLRIVVDVLLPRM